MVSSLLFGTVVTVSRPNIIVIYSDDHARSAISAYGSPYIKTKGIDRLAKEGTLFTRHYSTNPLCAPSRATLLTGKYSHVNGHKDNRSTFDPDQETMPKILQANGYQTAAIGKWHLKSTPQGFDYYDVLRGQGLYYNPRFITEEGEKIETGYSTDLITEKSLNWLKNRSDKPFFMFIGHKAPHRNWQPHTSKLDLFVNTKFPKPKTLRTDYSSLCSEATQVMMRIDELRPQLDLMLEYTPPNLNKDQKAAWESAFTPQDIAFRKKLGDSGDLLGENYQRYMQNYLRCIASVDDGVSEILDYLDDEGLSENTVVIYTSDQGFFLGENAWYDKRWFYEPSGGTPLIIRAPGLEKGKTSELTCDADFAPTILNFAGLDIPEAMQGQSILEAEERNVVYGHFYESDDVDHKAPKWVGIATKQHKLMFYYDLEEWELFDLKSDPDETKNLWSSPAKKDARAELVRKLLFEMRKLDEDAGLMKLVKQNSSMK